MSQQEPLHITIKSWIHEMRLATYWRQAHVGNRDPVDAGPQGLQEPDLSVVRGTVEDYARRHPRADETLLIIEIALTTQEVDPARAAIYAHAGAPVYWLLDAQAHELHLHEEPGPRGYGRITRLVASQDIDLPGIEITWSIAALFP